MRKFLYFCFGLVLCLPAAPGWTAEQVVLQLKWLHAYQFAGYYMAKEKGYYRDAGLNVDIREGGPHINIVEEVVSGHAHYATGATGILLDRNQGKPVVVLGVIFQHSPDVLFVSEASDITHPQQLVGKTVMDSASTPAIAPMLLNEAGALEKFNIIPQDNNYAGLIDGRFDATAGYITDEPYFYREQNFPIAMLKPVTYGIDFYGDNLFTSEQEISEHPERAKAFSEASFKGWEYAMQHPEETIGVIQKYGSTRTPEHLHFEYKAMRKLIMPEFIEIGFMNPGRWKSIADTYVKLGQLRPEYSLVGFLYDPHPVSDIKRLKKYILGISAVTLGTAVIILLLLFFNRRLAQQREALRVSEEQQRLLISQSPAAIAMLDRDLRYLSASDRWRSDYQLGDQVLTGRSHYEVFPEIPERWRAVHQRCLAGAVEKCEEDRFERQDGTVQWLRWEVRPWFEVHGKIGGILLFTENITERKQTQEQVQRLAYMLDESLNEIYVFDANTLKFQSVNRGAREKLGYSMEELCALTPLDLKPEYTPESFAALVQPLRTGEQRLVKFTTVHRCKDGSTYPVEVHLQLFSDTTPAMFIAIILDITERKQAEDEKNKQAQRSLQYKEILLTLSQQPFANLRNHFHAITEAAARALNVERVGLWFLNNNTLECEDQYLASTGTHQHLEPYSLSDASPYINALKFKEVVRADNARTDPRTGEFGAFFASRDIHSLMDVPIWSHGSMVGVLGCDHTGMIRHWTDLEEEFASHLAALVSTAIEAEERRRAEKAIMDLNESLEQRVAERTAELSIANAKLEHARNAAASASEAKSEFLSRMSHELRTPLHAILGFSQFLEEYLSNAAPEVKKSVRQILYSGQHLLELINETLDLARIEGGKLELVLEDLDLNHSICKECLEQVRGLAEKNNIAVHMKAAASPIMVYADRIRLKQVLLNLLSNAIKYNRPQGSVILECHAPRRGRVRVTIDDTGMGIPPDQKDRVFQPFTRVHRLDNNIEGTGIGLNITRRLVEGMGGKIGFTSKIGVGSTFWFELRAGRKTSRVKPLTSDAVESIAATSATSAIKGKVLYIEDTTANVHLMRMIVGRLPGVELLDANTAEFGIVLAMEQHPDLILMDIDLPGMDGIEALHRLRRDEKTRDISVIAVSAAAMTHDLERIQQAGFDDILSKPFNIQSVPALLEKHLSGIHKES